MINIKSLPNLTPKPELLQKTATTHQKAHFLTHSAIITNW